MMQFDATNPYHRYMLHYESDQQLSLPEIMAQGSIDAHTAALIWLLIEHRASFIIAGPTDPTPGVGKTTTLNALLPFYPTATGLVYTLGMYEDFAFTNQSEPQSTTVLANEVSNHLRIYMWGRVARQFLQLPGSGYAVATSCHADTIDDVMQMLTTDIHLQPDEIEQLQFIINIGITGRPAPRKRRWLTSHIIVPTALAATNPTQEINGVHLAAFSRWDRASDTFQGCEPAALAAMLRWTGLDAPAFDAAVARREACLRMLADEGADQDATIEAIQVLRQQRQE